MAAAEAATVRALAAEEEVGELQVQLSQVRAEMAELAVRYDDVEAVLVMVMERDQREV